MEPDSTQPTVPPVPRPDITHNPPAPPIPPVSEPAPGASAPVEAPAETAIQGNPVTASTTVDAVVGDLAPLGTRISAAVIDILVAIGLQIVISFILPNVLGFVASLTGLAYIFTRDALPFLDGQSVGKKAMKLRAVTRAGAPLTGNWQPCLIRNAVLAIPFFGLVELIVLLTRQDKPDQGLRLGDEWAKTKVIVVAPSV